MVAVLLRPSVAALERAGARDAAVGARIKQQDAVVGRHNVARAESAMLWACLNCSGWYSRPSGRAFVRAGTSSSRTCSYAIEHGRRELMHVNVTANPTTAWIWRQLFEATPWGHKPRHLLHDRDGVYGRDFRQRARRLGIDRSATPVRAPRANAVAERVIGTLRRECLDHIIVLNEQHLSAVLTDFVRYYNHDRPHRTLRLQTPKVKPRSVTGPIRSRLVLNGLHHVYERAA
jgi:Integrase core domain